jgi:hypothetical protein
MRWNPDNIDAEGFADALRRRAIVGRQNYPCISKNHPHNPRQSARALRELVRFYFDFRAPEITWSNLQPLWANADLAPREKRYIDFVMHLINPIVGLPEIEGVNEAQDKAAAIPWDLVEDSNIRNILYEVIRIYNDFN